MELQFKFNDIKINQLLSELDDDRNKLFRDINNSYSTDKMKETKIKQIENIQRALFAYKLTLFKEKENKDK